MFKKKYLLFVILVCLLLHACQSTKASDQQQAWWKIDYATDPDEIKKFGSNVRTDEGPEDRAYLSLHCPQTECEGVPPAIAYTKFEKLTSGDCVADYDDQMWCPKFNGEELVGVFPQTD